MPLDDRDYMRKRATYDPKVFRSDRAARSHPNAAHQAPTESLGAASWRTWPTWAAIAAAGVAVVVYERRTDPNGGPATLQPTSSATEQVLTCPLPAVPS